MKQVCYSTEELKLILEKHIIRGDRSDGIPNIHSSDDCFVNKIRQTPITTKLESSILECPITYCKKHGIIQNYERNQLLIDFAKIPKILNDNIIHEYNIIKNNLSKKIKYV